MPKFGLFGKGIRSANPRRHGRKGGKRGTRIIKIHGEEIVLKPGQEIRYSEYDRRAIGIVDAQGHFVKRFSRSDFDIEKLRRKAKEQNRR